MCNQIKRERSQLEWRQPRHRNPDVPRVRFGQGSLSLIRGRCRRERDGSESSEVVNNMTSIGHERPIAPAQDLISA